MTANNSHDRITRVRASLKSLEAKLGDDHARIISEAEQLIYDLTPPPAQNSVTAGQGVKVKPLEWIDGAGLSYAQTNLVACYSVWDVEDGLWLCSLVDGQFPTIEAAKAAAQADYERRILSALRDTP